MFRCKIERNVNLRWTGQINLCIAPGIIIDLIHLRNFPLKHNSCIHMTSVYLMKLSFS